MYYCMATCFFFFFLGKLSGMIIVLGELGVCLWWLVAVSIELLYFNEHFSGVWLASVPFVISSSVLVTC